MRDDDRPPLPPTCRTDEPWVEPWPDDEPLVDWGESVLVSYGGGPLYGIAMGLSLTVLSILLGVLVGLALL